MAKKSIPRKNYVILIGLIVLVICACLASYNIYNIFQENRISTSPLASKEINYEDLKNTTLEMDADAFLVISYTDNPNVHNNESEIKKYLNRNNLIDNVLYLNVSEYMTTTNFVNDLNDTLKLGDNLKIKKFPAMIYYKDGIPTYRIDSSDHLLNKDDFSQVIDMYDLAS